MAPIVKICGITSPADAQSAANAGADAIGFMFAEASPRRLDLEQARAIAAAVPPFVARVGVFVDPSPDLVSAAIAAAGLTMLQFHGQEPPDFCGQFGLMTIKAFRMKDRSVLEGLPAYATDAWLLDSYVAGQAGGTGARFNWDLAVAARALGRPIFLAGGLTAENVAEAVQVVRPYGVDVSSGVESSPGRKDPDKIRRFISAVKSVPE